MGCGLVLVGWGFFFFLRCVFLLLLAYFCRVNFVRFVTMTRTLLMVCFLHINNVICRFLSCPKRDNYRLLLNEHMWMSELDIIVHVVKE